MIVLGIETSCDETAAALLRDGRILSNIVASQNEIHSKYGGVVPELASRRHMETILPIIKTALNEAKAKPNELDAIAVTYAPGLIGSLLVGLCTAKAMSYALKIPFIGINHLEGHLNAIQLVCKVPYPHIGLIISGGHTDLYLVEDFGKYKLLGATRDDAAGEAFDKVAKLLNLGYPGGPVIDKVSKTGDPKSFQFTKPRFGKRGTEFDFSFSGIKTAALHHWRSLKVEHKTRETTANLAASFQSVVVDILCEKAIAAAIKYNCKVIVASGGVAANTVLRNQLKERAHMKGINTYIPPIELCTDNAAMIAYAGWRRLQMGETSPYSLNAVANLTLE